MMPITATLNGKRVEVVGFVYGLYDNLRPLELVAIYVSDGHFGCAPLYEFQDVAIQPPNVAITQQLPS